MNINIKLMSKSCNDTNLISYYSYNSYALVYWHRITLLSLNTASTRP